MRTSLVLAGTLALCGVFSFLSLAAKTARADANPVLVQNEAAIADTDDELPGEIAVDVRDELSAAELSAIQSEYGLHPNSAWSDAHDKLEVALVSLGQEPALLERLARDPRVEHAEPMAVL